VSQSGFSLEEAGKVIRASHSKMSRLEARPCRLQGPRHHRSADPLRSDDEQERDSLRALARQASGQGWWHDYSDILPAGLRHTSASKRQPPRIRRLLRSSSFPACCRQRLTPAAVTVTGSLGRPPGGKNRAPGKAMRMAPSVQLLRGPRAPQLWAVDWTRRCLRRPVGGASVMREQLEHLIECAPMAERDAPGHRRFQAGGHPPAAGGPFSILRFAEADLPDVSILEQLTSAMYLDKRELFDHYLV